MNKQKLLEAAQAHGDLGFLQGVMAAWLMIDIGDRKTLGQMDLASLRIAAYSLIWDALKNEVKYA